MSAFEIINNWEPVNYDRTHNLVNQYTPDTPRYYQCGLVSQSVQKAGELNYSDPNGDIDDERPAISRYIRTLIQYLLTQLEH